MSGDTFEDFARELDALCQQRAAVYPVRDRSYAALSARLVEFCRWLERSRPEGWEPNATLVQRAGSEGRGAGERSRSAGAQRL